MLLNEEPWLGGGQASGDRLKETRLCWREFELKFLREEGVYRICGEKMGKTPALRIQFGSELGTGVG